MANLNVAQKCPRKAFLNDVPAGVKKSAQLRSMMKEILLGNWTQVTKSDLEKQIETLFDQKGSAMLPFEADKEKELMKRLLWRYYEFEQDHQLGTHVLAENESVKVHFAGKDHTVSVHRLLERDGGQLETISYSYKIPDTKPRSKKNNPRMDIRLLLLQMAGEQLAQKLGKANTTVFGAIYSLKSASDGSTMKNGNSLLPFEDKTGCNIASYHFDKVEQQDMEHLFATVVPSSSVEAYDCKDCQNCAYNDLCHVEFQKRKKIALDEKPIKPIDTIRLTPSQMELVQFNRGICRTDAVAGSGKTTVVTLRTLRLLEDGVDPEHILMITFTEKAAKEMQERLAMYQKGKAFQIASFDSSKVVVKTFNGWGDDLLGEYYQKLGFQKKPQLIDDVEKKDIIISLLNNYRKFPLDYRNPFMDLPGVSGCVPAMSKLLDAMKAAHVSTEEDVRAIAGYRFDGMLSELLAVYNSYNETLLNRNLIDYEDQLRLILKLEAFGVFKDLPYEHIVVDEFQDSNPNQIDIISKIVYQDQKFQSLVVVGDNMQAIYGFRNASPENLVNFDKLFPNVVDIKLADNFRSNEPIVSIANNILARESAMKKAIISHRKENKLHPVMMKMEDVDREKTLFVKQVKKLIADGHKPSSIAILCRTKSELVKMQEAMAAVGIPTILKVPEIMSDSPYVKAIISLASFLRDENDLIDLSFFAKSLGQDPFDTALLEKSKTAILNGFSTKQTESEKLSFFFNLCQDASEDYVAAEFLNELQGKNFKTLNSLLLYCVKYKKYEIKEAFSTRQEDAEAVNLITIHSAKGLEWSTVLLSLRKFRDTSEEKRLLYVAVTRAKERLLITYTDKQYSLISLLKNEDEDDE